MTYADLFWVIIVALTLAIAYILWTTREKKETEKNLFRDKRGSSALVVLIEVAAVFVFLYIVTSALGVCPQSAKNGVNWVSSNFGLLVFLSCFSVGAYLVFKITDKKSSPRNNRTFSTPRPVLTTLFYPFAFPYIHYAFSITAPGNWPHFSFLNYCLRKSGSGLSC